MLVRLSMNANGENGKEGIEHRLNDLFAGMQVRLEFTDEFDPNMPEIIAGDSQRLQQILVNLVNNSVKFTEKGGIHVRILCSDKNHWTIEVTDTGSGIPDQEISYIFETFRQVESFTTRQHGGFGLGLSIVKQLVELMNGEIIVKSELGKGSTFTITLPL